MLHPTRTTKDDTRLGILLAIIGGSVNAGGFLAIGRYTSHMTGLLSTVADEAALQHWSIVGVALLGIASFTSGAALSSVLVNYNHHKSPYIKWALPLCLEALLITLFGVYGTFLPDSLQVPALGIMLLCGLMGLQNATITKISGARIRTTHVTGMFTDLGIELGRALCPKVLPWVIKTPLELPTADIAKVRLLGALILSFLSGGLLGAFGFNMLGMAFAFPLAAVLFALTLPVLWRAHVL